MRTTVKTEKLPGEKLRETPGAVGRFQGRWFPTDHKR